MGEVLVLVRRATSVELLPSRSVRRGLAVCLFAVLTAIGAYVIVPLPVTPVPVTLQSLFVVLAGALLGPGLGAASQALYVAVGLAGLPVFSGAGAGVAHVLGPTGGYLIAFPAAAAVTGWLAPRSGAAARSALVIRLALALLAGSAVIFLGGLARLTLLTGDVGSALELGLFPFVPGGIVKLGLALLIASRLRRRTLEQL
ncbi:MAG: biotin transporter BioY [Longimicrobiales bacterium]